MAKYNFYKLKEDLYKGDVLPEDVNEPVKEYLNRLGATAVITALEKKERRCQCGKIVAFDMRNLMRRFEIKTNYGMVEGFDIIEEIYPEGGNGFATIDYTHIKNTNLSMKKPLEK